MILFDEWFVCVYSGYLVESSQWKHSFHCLRQPSHVQNHFKNSLFKNNAIVSIIKISYIDVSTLSLIKVNQGSDDNYFIIIIFMMIFPLVP